MHVRMHTIDGYWHYSKDTRAVKEGDDNCNYQFEAIRKYITPSICAPNAYLYLRHSYATGLLRR